MFRFEAVSLITLVVQNDMLQTFNAEKDGVARWQKCVTRRIVIDYLLPAREWYFVVFHEVN